METRRQLYRRRPILPSHAILTSLLACTAGPGEVAQSASAAPVTAETEGSSPPSRILAVGDLHGDREAALAVLRMAGVVDASGHWSAGNTVLVQTGDTTDRGPDSKGVIDLLRQLSTEAQAAGGRVEALLGNHETMNLLGDWRYVSPADLAGFGGSEARQSAFGPEGDYGRWLRARDTVARVGDTIFVHGGVTPTFASRGIDAINSAVRDAVQAGDRSAPVLGAEGPLWFRGYVQQPEAEACPQLAAALAHLDAKRMVVGHTTRRDGRVEVRCGGRLAVIDTGISAHYGGHLAAWTATDGDASVLYPTGPLDVVDPE